MTHIEKSVVVNAPIEKVFEVLDDPKRAGDLNPDLKLLSYTRSSVGGYDNQWEYKMAGMKFSGETKIKEYQRPKRVVFDTTGGIPSHWEWTLQPEGNATRVSLSLDYTVPGSLLGAVANKLMIERQNEQAIERQLQNLKRFAEGG